MLVVCSVFTATGCAEQNVVQDGKTVNVKVFKAGYGTTWLYRLKEKFEEVYKEQGYKVNILEPDNSLKTPAALSEMRAGKKSGVDLYFVQSVTVEQALDAEYGACAEDLTDVYDSPAISFDGNGENSYNEKYKLNVGNHTATLVAKDKAGNESKVEIKITVKD